MIKATIAQFPVSLDVHQNADQILSFVDAAEHDELLVLPEGALSGYSQDMSFLNGLAPEVLNAKLDEIAARVVTKSAHVFLGTVQHVEGGWGNLGVYLGPDGSRVVYQKCNLATAERGHMVAGSELPVFEITVGGMQVPVAMQLCREIRYPAQWEALARKGAQVFLYLTNAIGGAEHYPVWRAHIISRAAETQRFVLGSNNAAADQVCPTLAVAPNGSVLAELSGAEAGSVQVELDLDLVSNWNIDQAREGLV